MNHETTTSLPFVRSEVAHELPVFVDPSGRRARRFGWAASVASLVLTAFVVVLAACVAVPSPVPHGHLPTPRVAAQSVTGVHPTGTAAVPSARTRP